MQQMKYAVPLAHLTEINYINLMALGNEFANRTKQPIKYKNLEIVEISRFFTGEAETIRTSGQLIRSQVLYPLSYCPINCARRLL